MDDSCAVCAETLGWVAYGPCGHREVCSTCIIRLRFICDDRSCCICKCESNIIFVTKALGDYTNLINDFSAFPNNPIEGRVGQYWFHVGAQAYFDDFDHYKMMKAMCKLSCSACDGKNEQRNGGSKSTRDFNSVGQLKTHLFEKHRLFMCSLCLEGRKIFISEQKLYNRAQLNQHVKTGDSVVDGSENERGGFMGHPTCEFCQNPFYGDNELYLHMSTEHFTCHICQRRHPGKYEYYKDYDDMEIHFRREHFLCEDSACLAKKFIVFASESEMKRHDTMEHGGRMSRSKHSAIMQIPASFQYQRNAEQDQWCRGRRKHSDSSSIQLSMGIQENLEISNALRCRDVSLNGTPTSSRRERRVMESTANPFELLGSTDSEMSSRCCQALGQNSARTRLEQTSFPPLHITLGSSGQRSRNAVLSCGNTMAAHLRRQISVRVVNTSRASPVASSHLNSPAGIIPQARPIFESRPLSPSSSLYVSHHKLATNENAPSSHRNSFLSKPSTSDAQVSSNAASSSRTGTGRSKVSHCSSAPNLVKKEILDKTTSDPHVNKATTGVHPLLKVEDAHAANKALVEKIRAALDYDNDKFAAFKVISVEYRQDLIDTAEYLAYVHQFGLENLVLDLALLCPNAQKQLELAEIHNYNMRRKGSSENCSSSNDGQPKGEKSSRKGKEKFEDNGFFSSDLAVKLNSGRMNLQVNDKPPLVEVELPSKGKAHSAKIESEIVIDEQSKLKAMVPKNENDAQPSNGSSTKIVGSGWEMHKPRKKMSKFLKHRLGETSATEKSVNSNIDVGIDEKEEQTYLKKHPPENLQVHGVWQNGGGRRLVVMAQKIAKR